MSEPIIDSTLGNTGLPGVSRFVDGTGSNTTVGGAHSTGGNDRAILAWCMVGDANKSFTSVTYGGVSMTDTGVSVSFSGGAYKKQLFYLANPASGSNTLIATISTNGSLMGVTVVGFNDVNQATPVGSAVSGSGVSGGFSITLSLGFDETGVMEVFGPGASSATPGVGVTERYDSFDSNWAGTFFVASEAATGTVAIDAAWDVFGVSWGGIGVPLKPVTGTNQLISPPEFDFEIKPGVMAKNIVVT